MPTLLGLAAIIALILANGFFVAAEFAYVAVRRTHLEERAGEGDAKAQRALDVLRRLSFVLSGAQLGITITSLVLGFVAAPVFIELLGPVLGLTGVPALARAEIAAALGFVLATGAQMVFGELAPKNLAIAKPEAFARALATPTRLYTATAGPVIRLFDSAANGLLRRVGIEPVEEIEAGVSAEDLEFIIVESTTRGHLSPEQSELLTRVLEFRQLRAADVMVPRPQIVALSAEHDGTALRRLALHSGHSRFPVIDHDIDEVVGIVQAKSLLRIPPHERERIPVRALLSPILAVPESSPLAGVVAEMRRGRSPMAVVIDEYGATSGIVTLEDVVEELVGSIQDEYDPVETRPQPVAGGGWRVPGNWRIDETERDTGVELPAGDYDTVGGLVMAELGRVPEPGDAVHVAGAELVVETMEGLAVGRVLIRRDEEPA
jgi:CBS domain containing-hemolysin-like protein